MNIVIDSYILMSILIKKSGKTFKQFQALSLKYKFFIHYATIEELSKHRKKLLKASKLTIDEFESFEIEVLLRVKIVQYYEIPIEIQDSSFLLVADIDEDDAAFVAASIYLSAILWSGDKPLYTGLHAKGFTNIFDAIDIDKLLESNK